MQTFRLGLIGFPIGHSKSPALFRSYFAGHPEILRRYSYGLIEYPDFDDALEVFREKYIAANVTAPFKEDAFRIADIRSEEAEECHAANLLLKTDEGKIKACNTDYTAVRHLLKSLPCPGRVLVIGCGGAGKASAAAAISLGYNTSICNRSPGHAALFCGKAGIFPLKDLHSAVREADTVIYTLPSGIPALNGADWKGKAVIEASYSSPALETPVQLSGGLYVSGMKWLAIQAEATYRTVIRPFCPDPEPGWYQMHG